MEQLRGSINTMIESLRFPEHANGPIWQIEFV